MNKYKMLARNVDSLEWLGSGCSRDAYYARNENVVIKIPHSSAGRQEKNEFNIFKSMHKFYLKVFPVVDIIKYNKKQITVMQKCEVLAEFAEDYDFYSIDWESYDDLLKLAQDLELDTRYVRMLHRFITEYSLYDLFENNLGVFENRLVIIDAGG
jgi:hypothetical protein